MNKYIEVAAYESPMSHLVAGVLGAGLEEGEEEVVAEGNETEDARRTHFLMCYV